ncbi:MAG: glycosyltransferase involved in cell wall biosynthesis [Flavobacteriaceae bacterium]|jgi:glycosyltransferase involved in cell wall biosynthesis
MVSDEQTEFVNANFNKKALTITSAINIPNPNSYTSNVLSRFGLIQNKYILFLGRLVQEKNPDLLIKAFKRSNLQDLKLVIAGYDDRAKKYIDSLVQMGLNNKNVIFTGAVYGDDKEVLLRDCHSFCIPSSLEGLPITLLEAMSYSKLCIASNIPACKEAMGSTGLYFKDKDIENLISVLNSLEQSDIILERNDAFVRVKSKFTWDIVSKQYEQFCKSIVGNF